MKLRIGAQLAAGYAVPIVTLALIVGAVVVGFAHVRALNRTVIDTSMFRSKARDIMLQTLAGRYATRTYTLTTKRSALATQKKAMQAAQADVGYLVAHAANVPGTGPHAAAAARLIVAIDGRSLEVSRVVDHDRAAVLEAYLGRKDGRYAESYAAINGNVGDFKALETELATILHLANLASTRSAREFDAQSQWIELMTAVLAAAAVLATIVITILQSRRMSRRLNRVSAALDQVVQDDFSRLSEALARLSRGDLRAGFQSARAPLGDRGGDEIGDLARSYDALSAGLTAVGGELTGGMAQLRALIGGVTQASRSLAIASEQTSSAANEASVAVEQIARSVDSVADGAKRQAGQIAQAGAAIEELSRSAEMIADGAVHQAAAIGVATGGIQQLDDSIESLSSHGTDLARSAREASAETGGGTAAVSETQRTMLALREVSQRAADAMVSLEARSSQVEDIVQTIEQIADQTNLLALNAAIEAARAGEHGRGFAVVADEVRKLAERSGSATGEISAILSAIRRDTVSAAQAMRASDASMEGGLAVAKRAGDALTGVERAIGTTSSVADELADRARQMRAASLRITESVSSASAAVEENAAAASQMRSTTHEVTSSIVPVATAAQEQSAAAHEAALATTELAAGVQQIDATARALRGQAADLDALVARFVLDDAPAAEPQPACEAAPSVPAAEPRPAELVAV